MHKLEDIIKQKKIIDIDLAPNSDNVFTGMCLVANSKILMLLNLDDENGEFDGFIIVQNEDVEKYREWEKDDYSELKNDNSESLISNIELKNFADLESSLKNLTSELVSLFTYEDENSFFVGKILSVNNDSVELHLVDEDSNWKDIKTIKLSEISFLGFETEYERKINKNAV
ncbi:MAG: hypothetical protein KKD36_09930 [Bacteroidetes bacterium]|nr:hypothetical protein [Bacteroidota bacterium]